ncbi:hypothetical protein FRB91_007577 [Serendipita sp. 411]|nr:hypothetical protein FRB91_007577 [Serendipita sp. 411]
MATHSVPRVIENAITVLLPISEGWKLFSSSNAPAHFPFSCSSESTPWDNTDSSSNTNNLMFNGNRAEAGPANSILANGTPPPLPRPLVAL